MKFGASFQDFCTFALTQFPFPILGYSHIWGAVNYSVETALARVIAPRSILCLLHVWQSLSHFKKGAYSNIQTCAHNIFVQKPMSLKKMVLCSRRPLSCARVFCAEKRDVMQRWLTGRLLCHIFISSAGQLGCSKSPFGALRTR